MTHPALQPDAASVDTSSDVGTLSRRHLLRHTATLGLGLSMGWGGSALIGADAAQAADSPSTADAGLLHTEADFQRVAAQLAAGVQPTTAGWQRLLACRFNPVTWRPNPQVMISRNNGRFPDNYIPLCRDVAVAYVCALRWRLTGDTAMADKAVLIMNAWSGTLQGVYWFDGKHDSDLVAGFQGYQFAIVGDLMRSYSGWAPADFERFRTMMRGIFYPINSTIDPGRGAWATTRYANWALAATAAVMAIGVLCDDRRMFKNAVWHFKQGHTNGAVRLAINHLHPGHMGQTQESGRDQGHNTLVINLLATICEMAWNQGEDLYGFDNNRVLAAAEYVAKGNLPLADGSFPAMPFAPYAIGNQVQTEFSNGARGAVRPGWALLASHYVGRLGLAAPYTLRMAERVGVEGGNGDYGNSSGAFDQLGYGTLMHTRALVVPARKPVGLVAQASAGQVELSWWGVADGTSYSVWRRTAGQSQQRIATGITDLLTFTDTAATPDRWWQYAVSAVTPAGEGPRTAWVKAHTGVVPHTLLALAEGSGTSIRDSLNGTKGTLSGDVTWAAGPSTAPGAGQALVFGGNSSQVAISTGPVEDLADFTASLWVWWDGVAPWERVFEFGTAPFQYMYFTPRNHQGRAAYCISSRGGQNQFMVTGTGALPVGRWCHVAVTQRGNQVTLYIDGRAAGMRDDVIVAPWRLNETRHNWLGRNQDPTTPRFKGRLAQFALYRGAMPAEQVAQLARV